MQLSLRQEEFSKAYVRAVSAVAGFSATKPEIDDDSIDLIISGRLTGRVLRSPRLEIQLKGPFKRNVIRPTCMSYSLEKKNYDDLRDSHVHIPRILVVVILADLTDDWLDQSSSELKMRHCAYWVSLRGSPPLASGQNSKSIRLSTNQIFNARSLTSIMQLIADGGHP